MSCLKSAQADAYSPAREQLGSIITHLQSINRMTLNDPEQFAEAASKESYDDMGATIHKQTGVTFPKRQREECVGRAAQEFESFDEQQRAAKPREVKASNEILVTLRNGGKTVGLLPRE